MESLEGKIIQRGNEHHQLLCDEEINISPRDKFEVEIPQFNVDQEFTYNAGIMLRVEIPSQSQVSNSRMLWLGMDEPKPNDKYPF